MRYALIQDNLVANVVELDDAANWHTPTDLLVQSDTASIGDGYDGANIIPQPVIIPEMTLEQWKQQIITALAVKDNVANRCFENGILLPSDWANYAKELRNLLKSNTIQDLPIQPLYPQGT
jgi:hypothetical protein